MPGCGRQAQAQGRGGDNVGIPGLLPRNTLFAFALSMPKGRQKRNPRMKRRLFRSVESVVSPRRRVPLLSPTGEENPETWRRADSIFDGATKPVAAVPGFHRIRLETIATLEIIPTQVGTHLINDRVALAGLPGHDPTVFCGLGLRHALRRPGTQLLAFNEKALLSVQGPRTVHLDNNAVKLTPSGLLCGPGDLREPIRAVRLILRRGVKVRIPPVPPMVAGFRVSQENHGPASASLVSRTDPALLRVRRPGGSYPLAGTRE